MADETTGSKPWVLRALLIAALAPPIALTLYGVFGLAIGLGFTVCRGPTQVAIRNRSGRVVEQAQIVLDYSDEEPTLESLAQLPSGEQHAVRPRKLDFVARLSFLLDGREVRHEERVDLWAGETYAFEIQPDGSIQSGHDHADPD